MELKKQHEVERKFCSFEYQFEGFGGISFCIGLDNLGIQCCREIIHKHSNRRIHLGGYSTCSIEYHSKEDIDDKVYSLGIEDVGTCPKKVPSCKTSDFPKKGFYRG